MELDTLMRKRELCFPNFPSTFYQRTVENILGLQNWLPKKMILYPDDYTIDDDKEDYEYSGANKEDVVDDDYVWSHLHFCRLTEIETPRYCKLVDAMLPKFSGEIFVKGQHLDIISLLTRFTDKKFNYLVRNNGDRVKVDSLRGKNVVLCCFYVPVFWLSWVVSGIRALPFACSNIFGKGNYEIVIVVKSRRSDEDEDDFNHFFSGFPTSCLAVPFLNLLCRDYLCKFLGLDYPKAVMVDKQYMVVHYGDVYSDQGINGLYLINQEAPFIWWKRHANLGAILNCESGDRLHKIHSEGTSLSILELSNKVVGLYLCVDGSFIRELNLIYEECQAQNKEFEVVLVYLPNKQNCNGELFKEVINSILFQLKISSWWVVPYNEFVSYRLWRVCEWEDKLVIVQPKGLVDPHGKNIFSHFGFNAYPFTREKIIQSELDRLKEITLKTLLVYESVDFVRQRNNLTGSIDCVDVTELHGKVVLLYYDSIFSPRRDLYDRLFGWYNLIKQTNVPDFEVVFVLRLTGHEPAKPVAMPWLCRPFSYKHSDYVEEKLKNGCSSCVIAFDKEGQICSLNALDVIGLYGPNGFPKYCRLQDDVIAALQRLYDINMTGMS